MSLSTKAKEFRVSQRALFNRFLLSSTSPKVFSGTLNNYNMLRKCLGRAKFGFPEELKNSDYSFLSPSEIMFLNCEI